MKKDFMLKSKKSAKLVSCVLAMVTVLCLSLTLLAVSVSAATTPIIGDVNGDGVVNGKDVTRLRKYVDTYDPETGTASVEISEGADVNEDGKVDKTDLEILLNGLASFDEGAPDADEKPVVKFGYYIDDDHIYYYDNKGVMATNKIVDGYSFDQQGHMEGNDLWVELPDGSTYYLISNKLVYDYQIINNKIYFFAEDGKMIHDVVKNGYTFGSEGYVEGNRIFVTAGDVTYYITNNTIVFGHQIINNNIYYFDNDGKMVHDITIDGYNYGPDGYIVGDEIFVTIGDDTYYLTNNTIVFDYRIINNRIYFFDMYGRMIHDTEKDGNTFGPDGYIVGDCIFVVIEGDIYYITNNTIVFNYQIINNHIYYFGEDGKMLHDGEKDGNTFGPDGYIIGDQIFIVINGDIYYLVDNEIVYGYQVINNRIYYFDEDGKMIHDTEKDGNTFCSDGYIVGDCIFVMVNGDTYYLVDNEIVYEYRIIDNRVYYFGSNGIMRVNETVNSFYHGVNGYIEVTSRTTIIIDDVKYWILTDNYAYKAVSLTGTVYESDGDYDSTNNAVLSGVSCTLNVNGEIFTAVSNNMGVFDFGFVPQAEVTLTFEKENYFDAVTTLELDDVNDLTIVMDIEVSNKLSGKITIADNDTNNANNAPLSGATVTIERTSSTNSYIRTTVTDSTGGYVFEQLTAGIYKITVSCPGYKTVEQMLKVKYNESVVQNMTIEAISNTQISDGYASGYIYNAYTGIGVPGLTLYIRDGIGNIFGDVIMTLTTDSNGYYKTNALAPGNYTVQVVDERVLDDENERYGSVDFAIKVMSDTTIVNQNVTISNSDGLFADSIRIVLEWGETPRDLDSHLYTTLDSGSQYHVFYSDKNPYNGASLDVDDTSSYGPETVTVTSLENGIYKYYVHDYTGGTKTNIKNSGASVKVYIGGASSPTYTFYAPNSDGSNWHVFTYNATTGEFIIVNAIGDTRGY